MPGSLRALTDLVGVERHRNNPAPFRALLPRAGLLGRAFLC